jgi:DNA polymerase III epsilon subunit-like protein
MWFESLDEPKAYNMDELRRFFGIELEGGHDALKDVRDTADLIVRFMKLTRKYACKVNFKGACAK